MEWTTVPSHVSHPNHAGRKKHFFFFFWSQPPQRSTVTWFWLTETDNMSTGKKIPPAQAQQVYLFLRQEFVFCTLIHMWRCRINFPYYSYVKKNRKETNKDLWIEFSKFKMGAEVFLTNSYFAERITEKNLRKIFLGIVRKHTSVRQTNSVGL